jgi:hypothetical protein
MKGNHSTHKQRSEGGDLVVDSIIHMALVFM